MSPPSVKQSIKRAFSISRKGSTVTKAKDASNANSAIAEVITPPKMILSWDHNTQEKVGVMVWEECGEWYKDWISRERSKDLHDKWALKLIKKLDPNTRRFGLKQKMLQVNQDIIKYMRRWSLILRPGGHKFVMLREFSIRCRGETMARHINDHYKEFLAETVNNGLVPWEWVEWLQKSCGVSADLKDEWDNTLEDPCLNYNGKGDSYDDLLLDWMPAHAKMSAALGMPKSIDQLKKPNFSNDVYTKNGVDPDHVCSVRADYNPQGTGLKQFGNGGAKKK